MKKEPSPPPAAEPHADLWRRYREGDRVAYEQLVDEYLPLVKATVSRLAAHLPSHISREDLYSAGCLGLVSAVERYDASHEARFRTYAITRIRGAIIDELRSHDILGRVTRDRLTRIQRAANALESKGEEAHAEAVAEAAGLTMDEYWDAEINAQTARQVSLHETGRDQRFTLEETLPSQGQRSPSEQLENRELLETVIDLLTPEEKELITLYYERDLTLKEIGKVIGVTESRVSQKHAEMTRRLRGKLRERGFLV